LPQLTDVLAEYLPRLGIPSASLALYENPSESLEFARLALAYTEKGRATLEAGGRRFMAGQLAPPDLLPARRYSLVVEPLYFQERSLGFLVCELGPHEGDVYELVRSNLSSALQGGAAVRPSKSNSRSRPLTTRDFPPRKRFRRCSC
jgi:hypothetical protein